MCRAMSGGLGWDAGRRLIEAQRAIDLFTVAILIRHKLLGAGICTAFETRGISSLQRLLRLRTVGKLYLSIYAAMVMSRFAKHTGGIVEATVVT